MKNIPLLHYKNYYGSVNIDPENNLLYGKIEFISALITYEAQDAKGLKKAFREAVDDYLAFCEQENISPEKPLKGSFNIRIGIERHRRIFEDATALHISLNEYICEALDERISKRKQNLPDEDIQAMRRPRIPSAKGNRIRPEKH